MNVYPSTFNKGITIYNQHKHIDTATNKTVTVWKRTVLPNCFFGTEISKGLNGNVLTQANSFICRIPQSRAYISPSEWSRLEVDKTGNYFTISPGDIIVGAIVNDDILDQQGKRISDLLEKYKGIAFTVKVSKENITIPYAAHYKATGV